MEANIPQLAKLEISGGSVREMHEDALRLVVPPTPRGYANAQVDDYRKLPRGIFPWRPPLRLSLKARASHPQPLGTFGFGFWNDPFTLSLGQGGAARRLPAAPRALWFFYGSQPNDLAFVPGSSGHGWKAVCLDSPSIPSLLLAPLAAIAMALAQVPGLRRLIMQSALNTVKGAERVLDLNIDEWHQYSLTWLPERVTFEVDEKLVLTATAPPKGPLGFVAWIDNQYAIASVEGGFRFGVIPTEEEQWLELAELQLEALRPADGS